ncbi:MAG TPA: isoprenylcysteine carboxylmethyltransferase family protein [Mycobacterium sp.]|jgi:protein-S-isoprenylcysteine O-methyltransferase Ste14|nr:isoprenylcysteine carboxylmethyltransferase family protein [Mycobacterium sp.]
MRTALKLVASSIIGLVVLGFILFYPAGSFDYWQAWVFIATFTIATIVPSLYLARTNPAALQRRMHSGPLAEGRTVQKFIIIGLVFGLVAMMALSAFDHRFGWSSVPAVVCVIGDVLVVAGLTLGVLVVIQNSYAAATVRVEEGQKLASRGLYKLVRHPMYAGSLILMVGIPLALGSYWGLIVLILGLLVLVFRIRDEEKMLNQELAGYSEYAQRVRYRLMPYVW